ncbi:MAG: methyltransferase domain-containing protein [Rhodospirillaceae bacterium]|nr:methyltransferase domain-containing protein [Rhodospirillaceae bacterium]
MDFAQRSTLPELMDTEIVTADDFAACLADLATVNRLTMAKQPTLSWLAAALRPLPAGSAITVLDVGFGQGDMLRAIWEMCQRRGLKAELVGVDLNPLSVAAAKRATPSHMQIDYRTGDVFALPASPQFDFIICSLLTHHLSNDEVVSFLRLLEGQSIGGWFINDLHRHPAPYHIFRLMAGIAGWHRFVRHDGPVSIARSFRRGDWEAFLRLAGVSATIRWHMPFRYCVSRMKLDHSSRGQ